MSPFEDNVDFLSEAPPPFVVLEAPPPPFFVEKGIWLFRRICFCGVPPPFVYLGGTRLRGRNSFVLRSAAPPPFCVIGGVKQTLVVGASGLIFRRVFYEGDLQQFFSHR